MIFAVFDIIISEKASAIQLISEQHFPRESERFVIKFQMTIFTQTEKLRNLTNQEKNECQTVSLLYNNEIIWT